MHKIKPASAQINDFRINHCTNSYQNQRLNNHAKKLQASRPSAVASHCCPPRCHVESESLSGQLLWDGLPLLVAELPVLVGCNWLSSLCRTSSAAVGCTTLVVRQLYHSTEGKTSSNLHALQAIPSQCRLKLTLPIGRMIIILLGWGIHCWWVVATYIV